MSWREDMAGSLPDPASGGGGPAADEVRRNIMDELADHLDCAARDERRRSDEADEGAIRAAVLRRFGDPEKVARRLWFDAMKEQIMSNRILIGTNIVLAIAVIAIAGFAWSSQRQNRQLIEELMARSEAAAARAGASDDLAGWSKLTFRVVGVGGEDPAVGFDLRLTGDAFNPGQSDTMNATTDEAGIATFGPLRPGTYGLRIRGADGTANERNVIAFPGRVNEIPIEWRDLRGEFGEVAIDLPLPDFLDDVAEYAWISFSSRPLTFSEQDGQWADERTHLSALINREGGVVMVSLENWPFVEPSGDEFHLKEASETGFDNHLRVDGLREYFVQGVTLLCRMLPESGEDGSERPAYRRLFYEHLWAPYQPTEQARIRYSRVEIQNTEATYRAMAGETTTWTVTLPAVDLNPQNEEFLKELRILPVE